MSELQPDTLAYDDDVEQEAEDQQEVVDNQETEDQETDSDSATDNTAKEQAVKFDEKQQEKVNELIADKVRKQREAERKAEKLERELNDMRSKMPEQTRPEIPPLPDAYALDEKEYKAKMLQREEAIRKQVAYDSRQEAYERQAEQARQAADSAKAEATAKKAQSYTQRAVQLGMTPEELQVAGNAVGQFGIDDALVELILEDDQGPLITKYLSKNIADLEALQGMSPARAAVMIATSIKQKASALKPKVNPAPDPVESPRQSGSTQRQRGPKGATFE